jgi:7-cyano-7-deazaguanine synthase
MSEPTRLTAKARAAVVLLSGGLDSATALAWARAEGFACHSLAFDYGQRHRVELDAARRVAVALGVVDHRQVVVDLGSFGGSALTAAIDVPKDREGAAIGSGIPITYVPARNAVFLSIALGWAEALGATDLVAGMNAVDYSGYPDCRPEFLRAFETLANAGTRAGAEGERFRIHAPLMELDKAGIVRLGHALGVDYSITHSCYDPAADGAACGRCDACLLRLKGFREAGFPDPTRYAAAARS